MKLASWMFTKPGEEMSWVDREENAKEGEVIVQVAGCGVCHTDLGFFYEGVPTRHPLPLTLGHEVSGTVVEAGPGVAEWVGRSVVVPAVIPCGGCRACREGRGSICPDQVFPGCDVHGGFATHLRVPAQGLCPVPEADPERLPDLSVIADAVTTPYQAIRKSGLAAGDLAVFVGVGGVGGFGVQIAAALGAAVVAIDVDAARLELMASHGADLCLNSDELSGKDLKKRVSAFAKEREIPTWHWKIFETSGHPAGQLAAFQLLRHGSYLSVVGYTAESVSLRFSNIMALDACVEGNWGCLPEHYPGALDLVLSGRVALDPFIERRPLSSINETFAQVHAREITRRVVLVPEVA